MAFNDGDCIQDQYGNQYTLTIDEAHQYITGTVSGGLGGGPWILTGSYVQSGATDPWIYELTGTNSNGAGQAGFVAVFKIKGVQPNGAWYYEDGYGAQEFSFTPCTAVPAMVEEGREALTEGERRGTRTA
jgi:hypothetical protein